MEVNRLCAENHYPWNIYDSLQRKFKTIINIFNKCSPVSQNLCALSIDTNNIMDAFDNERPTFSNEKNRNWLSEKPKRTWPRFLYPNINGFIGMKSITKPLNFLCNDKFIDRIDCDVNRYFLNQMDFLMETSMNYLNETNLNTAVMCCGSNILKSFILSAQQDVQILCQSSSSPNDLIQAIQLKCNGERQKYVCKGLILKTLNEITNVPEIKSEHKLNSIDFKHSQDEYLVKYDSSRSVSTLNIENCDGPYSRQNHLLINHCEQFQTFNVADEKTPKKIIDRMNNNDKDLNCFSVFHENQRNSDKYLSSENKNIYCEAAVPDLIMDVYSVEKKNETVLSSRMTVNNKISFQRDLDLMLETPNKSLVSETICSQESNSFLVVFDSDADNSGCDEISFSSSPSSPFSSNFKRPACENSTIAFIIGAASDSEDDEIDDDSDFGDDWGDSDDDCDDEAWLSLQPQLESSLFGSLQELGCSGLDATDLVDYDDEVDSNNSFVHSTRDLEEINRRWETDIVKDMVSSPSSKKVCFAEGKALVETHHMHAWSYAYQAARIGPWETYARDRARFIKRKEEIGQVISYVFTKEHRAHIFDRLKNNTTC